MLFRSVSQSRYGGEDSAATDLLTAKNLSGVVFASERLLSSGTGKKIKKLTFSGGLIWGYTI